MPSVATSCSSRNGDPMRILLHDIKNDITLIEGDFEPRFTVRYGLQMIQRNTLVDAMTQLIGCQIHALTSLGLDYDLEELLKA